MQNRDRVVSQLTSYLRGLARRRTSNAVTADDVQNYLNRKGFVLEQNERLSLTRSVLSEDNFIPFLTVPSKREAAKGRRVTQWIAK